MVYLAPMELQTQIDELKASSKRQKLINIALAGVIVLGVGVAANQPALDAEFDVITCKALKVVDRDGTVRIAALTSIDGFATVVWLDKDQKTVRIMAGIGPNGDASVALYDKDKALRIDTATQGDGTVRLPTSDLKK